MDSSSKTGRRIFNLRPDLAPPAPFSAPFSSMQSPLPKKDSIPAEEADGEEEEDVAPGHVEERDEDVLDEVVRLAVR